MDASSNAASGTQDSASLIEEPAEGLLSFVQGLVPVDWLSKLIVIVVALAVTALASSRAQPRFRSAAFFIHLCQHRARRHMGDRRERDPFQLLRH